MEVNVSFAALEPYVESNIVEPTEKPINGKEFYSWGDNNKYPEYLWGLYQNVTTLRTICNGIADYIVGENVTTNYKEVEDEEDTVYKCGLDLAIYGGFALQVRRGLDGNVKKIQYLNIKNIRSNKTNTRYYYSEDWSKSYGRVKYIDYPCFEPDVKYILDPKTNKKELIATSIYVYKSSHNMIYPSPVYAGDGCIAAETERAITEYHLNAISNGFSGSYIINMCNGVPEDKIKQEIEENFREKFTGFKNAGRPVLVWSKGKDNRTTIEQIKSEDFGDRYNALQKNSKQELYSAFRAHPVIFGLPTQDTGFNDQDFKEAFKLFNKTVILPMQKKICNAFDKILGVENAIVIEPFTIDWGENDNNNDKIVS